MTSRPPFYFDARSCSGCKACQVACKDKHALPPGLLWRRVYEVQAGDGWQAQGAAWQLNLAVYNLSLSCNHCEDAPCVAGCPTRAMHFRSDGIVLVDPEKCIGCQYCAWLCPYGAPQYDPAAHCMTKCTLCCDQLDAGLPPACVAACPLRSLEVEAGGRAFLQRHHTQQTPPLPPPELARPGLWIAPHPAGGRTPVQVVNGEETGQPPGSEAPLAAFTVLAPLAVGVFIGLGWRWFWALPTAAGAARPVGPGPAAFLGPLLAMAVALGLSLAHLGRPAQAYRAIANLQTSWLSREVYFASLFAAGLALWLPAAAGSLGLAEVVFVLTSASGLGLVYAIGRVYRQRCIAAWDTQAVQWTFVLSMLGLGALACRALLPGLGAAAQAGLGLVGWLALVLQLGLVSRLSRRAERLAGLKQPQPGWTAGWYLQCGLLLAVPALLWAGPSGAFAAAAAGLAAEFIGRLRFYRSRPA
ncbi:MAG: DmsC/YnfH family molybdoenzyme membrane anchor subunit [Chloroflexota bacterium]